MATPPPPPQSKKPHKSFKYNASAFRGQAASVKTSGGKAHRRGFHQLSAKERKEYHAARRKAGPDPSTTAKKATPGPLVLPPADWPALLPAPAAPTYATKKWLLLFGKKEATP